MGLVPEKPQSEIGAYVVVFLLVVLVSLSTIYIKDVFSKVVYYLVESIVYTEPTVDPVSTEYNRAVELNEQGLSYYNNQEYDEAEVYYVQAIEADPTFQYAYNNLGIIKSLKGDHAAALINYEKAVELDPNYANAWANIGYHYTQMGNYEMAIQNTEKAIQLNPNVPNYYKNLGYAYYLSSDFDNALASYQLAVGKGSTDPEVFEKIEELSNR